MSVDRLQNRIRKLKNPSMIAFSLNQSQLPPNYLEGSSLCEANLRYLGDLLAALKDTVAAVRFSFGTYALQGAEGLETLKKLLALAKEQDYYVLLDTPEFYSPADAEQTAYALFDKWSFDGLTLNCCLGSDGLKPFLDCLQGSDKDLFALLRTANKSASEIQDLLTGTRLVYTAVADMAARLGEGYMGKSGYSRVAGIGPATSADSLRTLRSKYPGLFILVDGYDYSGANAKNCSAAFDKLGHGAIACAGNSVVAAWQETRGEGVASAAEAAERMKKNLTRYITIL